MDLNSGLAQRYDRAISFKNIRNHLVLIPIVETFSCRESCAVPEALMTFTGQGKLTF